MSSQILKPLKGMTKLGHKWAGTSPEELNDESDIVEDGEAADKNTDAKMSKAQDEEPEGEELEGEEPNGGKAAMVRRLLEQNAGEEEPEEEEEPPVVKSFFDLVLENQTLIDGADQSPFLLEVIKSVGLSFDRFQDNVVDIVGGVHLDQVEFAKSLDEAFVGMGSRLGIIDNTADSVDMAKSVEADSDNNVVPLNKGGFGDGNEPSKRELLSVMEKSVQAGDMSPLELIKFESTGVLSPHIQKSLGL